MISVVSLFSGSIFQFKEIAETDYINFYRGFIVIYIVVGKGDFHRECLPCILEPERQIFVLGMENDGFDVILFGLQPDEKSSFFGGKAIFFVGKMPDCCVLHCGMSSGFR